MTLVRLSSSAVRLSAVVVGLLPLLGRDCLSDRIEPGYGMCSAAILAQILSGLPAQIAQIRPFSARRAQHS